MEPLLCFLRSISLFSETKNLQSIVLGCHMNTTRVKCLLLVKLDQLYTKEWQVWYTNIHIRFWNRQ